MDSLTPAASSVPEPEPQPVPPREGWAVAAGRGVEWWRGGWQIFRNAPGMWLVIMILFLAIMFALSLIPFLGQIVSSLLYPVLGAGVLVGAREVDRGRPLTIGHLFACFNDKAMPLIIVALLYFGAWFVIWLGAAALLVGLAGFGTVASLVSGDPLQAPDALVGMMTGSALVVVLVAVLLGMPLIMAYWFAPALVLFRDDEPLAAMKASFAACMRNVPPFLVFSLIGLLLAVLASIPLGLGWIVLLPVYVLSVYASYKDIYGEPA